MVEAAFGNQTVEDVVGKAVARAVFIGEADQAAGFVVMVAESMAQRIGTSGRQTVLAVFVGDFGLDCYEINISDDLCLSFCPRRRRCRTKSLSCRLF